MKALPLLKHNIDTLLKARKQTRRDLAQWVRQSMDNKKIDPWISHIFGKPDAEFQMKYLDRIADFFGLTVYQLFQPGIGPLAERRSGLDRRSGKDRRISALNHQVRESVSTLIASLTGDDVADLIRLRKLSTGSRDVLRKDALDLERAERENDARVARRRSADTVKGRGGSAPARGPRLVKPKDGKTETPPTDA